MSTDIKIVGDVAVVTVCGKLMGGPETKECHDKFKEAIANGIRKAVVDLSGAEWINSRGMGILIACYVSLHNEGGELRMAGESRKSKSLLKMTKLNTIFKNFDSVDEAIASFE